MEDSVKPATLLCFGVSGERIAHDEIDTDIEEDRHYHKTNTPREK